MATGAVNPRYGPVTFLAALANILVVGVAAWTFIPWWPLGVLGLPILLIDLVVAAILVARPGAPGHIGRGMLVGWLSAPLTLLLFYPGLVLSYQFGVAGG